MRSWFATSTIKGMNLINEKDDVGEARIYRLTEGIEDEDKLDIFKNGKKQVNFISDPAYGGQSYLKGAIQVPSDNTSDLTFEFPDLFSNILNNDLLLDSQIIDLYDYNNLGIVKINSLKQTPYENAPGFLYDFKINDKKAKYIAGPIWVNGLKKELSYDSDIFYLD